MASTPSSERLPGAATCSAEGSRLFRLREEDGEGAGDEREEEEGEEEGRQPWRAVLPLRPREVGPGGAMWAKAGEGGKERGPRRSCRFR